ncbi:MAG: hypothetical protein K8953_05275 [Proteobacteria bacterium]|nr:hypothetical protein [Pseudomonadota bacterium]
MNDFLETLRRGVRDITKTANDVAAVDAILTGGSEGADETIRVNASIRPEQTYRFQGPPTAPRDFPAPQQSGLLGGINPIYLLAIGGLGLALVLRSK